MIFVTKTIESLSGGRYQVCESQAHLFCCHVIRPRSEKKRVHGQSLSRLHTRTLWHFSLCCGPAATWGSDCTVPDSGVIHLPLQASFSDVDIRFYSLVPSCKRNSGRWVILPKGRGSKNPMKCFFFFFFDVVPSATPPPPPPPPAIAIYPPYLLLIILSGQRHTHNT